MPLFTALATMLVAVPAFADTPGPTPGPKPDPTVDVNINTYTPAGCPGVAVLRERLGARVSGLLAPSRVVVTIEQTDDAARQSLEIQIIDAAGVVAEPRHLTGTSCDELLSAAALILSIALLPADDIKPVEGINIESSDTGATFLGRTSRRSLPAESPIALRIGAIGAIDGGTLPSVASGAGAAFGITNGPLRVELTAIYFPRQRQIANSALMSGGDLSAFTTGARACLRPGPVALCAGGEWSLLSATGFGIDQASTSTFFLWGLTAAARWEMRLGERVVIATTSELVGRPRRPEFTLVNPDRVVHRPGWLSARLYLYGEVAVF